MSKEELPEEYNSVEEINAKGTTRFQIWYDRVRFWCNRKKIVIRQVNKVWTKSSGEMVGLSKKCIKEVEQAMKPGMSLENVANLDETSIQLFSLLITTLARKGSKSVRGPKHLRSRLALSCPVVWYGSGKVELIVVWSSKNKKDNIPNRWENNIILEGRTMVSDESGITWYSEV